MQAHAQQTWPLQPFQNPKSGLVSCSSPLCYQPPWPCPISFPESCNPTDKLQPSHLAVNSNSKTRYRECARKHNTHKYISHQWDCNETPQQRCDSNHSVGSSKTISNMTKVSHNPMSVTHKISDHHHWK